MFENIIRYECDKRVNLNEEGGQQAWNRRAAAQGIAWVYGSSRLDGRYAMALRNLNKRQTNALLNKLVRSVKTDAELTQADVKDWLHAHRGDYVK